MTVRMCREARLTISPVVTTDEGEYKCEITFLGILHLTNCSSYLT
jgi:hypothetical protein